MDTCLVAGGAGFIGAHLCKALLDKNLKVISIDNFISSSKGKIKDLEKNPNFSFINRDITKPLPDKIKANFVFHLASPASPNHHSKISYHALPLETMLANTTGTMRLLEFSQKQNAKFLFTSSSEIYGDPLEHPQTEEYRGNTSTTGPRSVYDESKRFGETIVAYFVRSKNVDARIARIFNTYGPGMMKEDKRMIVEFITQALEKRPLTVFGDGNQTRSLCFVEDLVEGLIKLMFSPDTKGEIVNLGSPEELSVLEYANLIKKLTNSDSEIVLSESLPIDDPHKRKPDVSKAKRLLDWEPRIKLEDGLQRTIEYFRSL
ncbi:MAG: NAD-dependent epimerase/dehydratase family protein [Candidatus Levybacteria bacterium]|nr:NAD-dependent epimerase/dehydratase family protein [Candidatus Levybacteria bacterium]